ncbi:MAG TPA: hypothetical protein VMF87_12235 [Streptosporangiaceae bacterium]|nr:hypothetical protein [Streptosporangiaceae bacterium]
MRSSMLARRAGAVAAAAVIATTGAMTVGGAAGASTTHAKRLHTHLSIADRRAVEHHKHVTIIAGRLSVHGFKRLPGRLVFLERITDKGKRVIIGREHTGMFGGVAFAVHPKMRTHYRLEFPGTPRLHSSRSRVVTVKG